MTSLSTQAFLYLLASPLGKHSQEEPFSKQADVFERNTDKPTLQHDLLLLLLKISFAALGILLVLTFVFGFHRSTDASMDPAIKDGDLLVYYRLDKTYAIGDVLALTYNGETQIRRVVATAGDTVNITEDGLEVNGSVQQEPSIYQETNHYEEGISLPLTLGEDQIFVLGDARDSAVDSRIYGALDADETLGKVVTILWRRSV